MLWAANVCSWAASAQPGPASSILLGRFLADRTIGRAFGTLCRLSVCLSVCRLSVTFCIQAKRLDRFA